MLFFYQISIHIYYAIISIAALFNPKAKQWLSGRKNIFEELKKSISSEDEIYWFHCASLGEFEQGKPIIDTIKNEYPNIKILVTFFSPSGYELRKNYENADYVFYLPLDTKKNAKKFIQIVHPKKAFFIKYEFWYNFLFELNTNKIPTYLISGVFRKEQPFFKFYGTVHQKMLSFFTHFFLQNEASQQLLQKAGYHNSTVTGDTRIDRVYENSLDPKNIPLIKSFKGNKPLIVVGSSWQKEEEIVAEFILASKKNYKYIIGSLHNILEPASFGNALLFGPKHNKFHEAAELLKQQAAYEIKDTDDLLAILNHLETDNLLAKTQEAASNYIKNGIGATQLILTELKL